MLTATKVHTLISPMKSIMLFALLLSNTLVVASAGPAFADTRIECRLSAEKVSAYQRIEIRFDDIFELDNPDDPRQADVIGVFTSPSGKQWRMPGFLYKDFKREEGGLIVPQGKPEWCVRFAPTETGRWKARVEAQIAGGMHQADVGAFEVTPAKARGFVRRAKDNVQAFEFENGEPLIAIGLNVFPTNEEETTLGKSLGFKRAVEVIDYMKNLAKEGGTFARLRMDYNHMPLEMTPDKATGYQGVGRYHAQTAWEVDRIIEAAEELDLSLMLCIACANTTADRGDGPHRLFPLLYNFYIMQNGGPLKAADSRDKFWTDPEVRRLFLQKIRYCVARWGSSSALGFWEFFNEVHLSEDEPERFDNIVSWHRDLAKQWRTLDPYNRPITTSALGPSHYIQKLFEVPEMDLVQYHTYLFGDLAQGLGAKNRQIQQNFDKPFMVGEFGSYKGLRKEQAADLKRNKSRPLSNIELNGQLDPTGLHLHNGIWASGLTGAAGALPWFTPHYIDTFDLYHIYTGFSRFVADWKINDGPWRPLEVSAVADPVSLADGRWGVLTLPSKMKGKLERRETDVYTVNRNELWLEAEAIQACLFGSDVHGELRRPPTFLVDYPVNGRFVATINYAAGRLDSKIPVVILLDGKEVARKVISINKEAGKKELSYTSWGRPQISLKEELAIDVPAGSHRIRVENLGATRVELDYRLENYLDLSLATYRVYAMGLEDEIRLWIQNAQSTHVNQYRKKLPTIATSAKIRVPVEKDGRYEVQWWNTYEGIPTRREIVKSEEGVLTLPFSGTTSDEACKISRIP